MVPVKCLLLRYGRQLLTIKDFKISGPDDRKSLRETFLGPKAAVTGQGPRRARTDHSAAQL
jgi:hypothetical protein